MGKLYTKEDLVFFLKKYENIFTRETYEYLNSLIELEFSALRDYISTKDKEALSEIPLYQSIVIYNIINRIRDLIMQDKESMDLYKTRFDVDKTKNKFFINFCFDGVKPTTFFNMDYKEKPIDISIYNILETKMNLINEKISDLSRKIEEINSDEYFSKHYYSLCDMKMKAKFDTKKQKAYDEIHYSDHFSPFVIEKLNIAFFKDDDRYRQKTAFETANDIEREINYCKSEIIKLKEIKPLVLSVKDQEIIRIINHYNDLIMDDFDISLEDMDKQAFDTTKEDDRFAIERTYIKKEPLINVRNNVKHV